MSDPIFPLEVWEQNTLDNSIPANDNALRMEALSRNVISKSTTAQPGSPTDGDVYIIPASATGTQWATFTTGDIAIYRGGTWYNFAPVAGVVVNLSGTQERWTGAAWTTFAAAGSTQGKQAIYVAAAAMRPSVSGGCAAIAAVATSANQPDLLTLDFDAGTDEFAQFSMVMPKKWNAGTMTARFHWTHGSTTTNFAVVWGIQALALSNDDAIAANYGTAVTVTDTGGTTNDFYTSDESSAMTAAGSPAKEDMVYFRVYRDADAGGDTLAVDAKLIGITLYVTTDADTDA